MKIESRWRTIGSDQVNLKVMRWAQRPRAAAQPVYDRYYFAHGCGTPYERNETWLNHFGYIADRIKADIAPRTVLDAGCAMGFLVESLRDRGIDASGIDISEHAISQVREDVQPYCRIGNLLQPLTEDYDLIVCIEVLEHLEPREADEALANLCRHSSDILFSSTPNDFTEATHVNVRPAEYWGDRFARQGFYRDVDYDAYFIAGWAVRFRKRAEPVPRVIGDYERLISRLTTENRALKDAVVKQQDELRRRDRG